MLQGTKCVHKPHVNSVHYVTGYAMYRYNNSHLPPVREDSIQSVFEDGHWSKPYFDCGGSYIWMITYTVPFFGYRNGEYYFK